MEYQLIRHTEEFSVLSAERQFATCNPLARCSNSSYLLHFKIQSDLCKPEPQDSQHNNNFTPDLRRFLKFISGNSDKSIHCRCSWMFSNFEYKVYDIIAVFLYIHNTVIYMCLNEYKYFRI